MLLVMSALTMVLTASISHVTSLARLAPVAPAALWELVIFTIGLFLIVTTLAYLVGFFSVAPSHLVAIFSGFYQSFDLIFSLSYKIRVVTRYLD